MTGQLQSPQTSPVPEINSVQSQKAQNLSNGHANEVNDHDESQKEAVNGDVADIETRLDDIAISPAPQPEAELHRFCAEGNLDEVRALLSRSLDALETLDTATGCTPIVLAIRNNHPEVVRELLTAGAIVPPPGLTNDPLLLSLLYPQPMYAMPPHFMGQHMPLSPQDYYGQYFPQDNSRGYMSFPPRKEGSPSGQSPNGQANGNSANSNLPPADVAKTIPCRNFPNCKYGSSCVFYHPRPPMQGYYSPNGYEGFVPFQPGMQVPYYQPFPPQHQQPQQTAEQASQQQQHQHQPPTPTQPNASDDTQHEQSQTQPQGQPPAFIPYANMTSPQQSQFGLSPLSPSALGSSLPPIPPPEVFFAQSPPNGSMMPPMNGFIPGMPGRRQSNQFGGPKPFGKKPSFSGGPRPWGPRNSVPGGTNGNLGSWKDGNPPPCAFFSQGKCRNGEFCKFPHLDAEGNDCRHPDVVRGLIAPLPTLSRQNRQMRMMNGNFGPYDPRQQPFLPRGPNLPESDSQQPIESFVPNGHSEPLPHAASAPGTTNPNQSPNPDSNSNAPQSLPSSVPPKPIGLPQISRSASQPGIARVHVAGQSSRSNSPAPSNVSFPASGPGARRPSRAPYTNRSSSTGNDKARPAPPQRVPGADEFPALSVNTSPVEKQSSQFAKTAAQVLSAPAPAPVPAQQFRPKAEETQERESDDSKSDENSVTIDSDREPDTVVVSHRSVPATPATPITPAPQADQVDTSAKETKRPASSGMSFASVASVGGMSPPVEPSTVALKA